MSKKHLQQQIKELETRIDELETFVTGEVGATIKRHKAEIQRQEEEWKALARRFNQRGPAAEQEVSASKVANCFVAEWLTNCFVPEWQQSKLGT
jgi:hypothetical protein